MEYIKDVYFTSVKNQDGTLLHWDKSKSKLFQNKGNDIVFSTCDKEQSVDSHINITLINNVILSTTHSRAIKIID